MPFKKGNNFSDLLPQNDFISRHNALNGENQQTMLRAIGLDSMDALISEVIPTSVQNPSFQLKLSAQTEQNMLSRLNDIAEKNKVFRSFIGQGYYDTETPAVILRNVLENPGWYTAYTPYQPEISQGRLEALLNFQHMVTDLTAMNICNASLLDEATAAAEAMTLARRSSKSASQCFVVANDIHPQTLAVLKTRAQPLNIEIVTGVVDQLIDELDCFGVFVQNPTTTGEISDLTDIITKCHDKKIIVSVSTDLLALTLIKPPGEMGADIVVGSAQRFGVPMGFGGPHAAFMAVKKHFVRSMPGRLIGVSKDSKGKLALRMSLQTREQHIRREKATSNICTAQVLLANMAGFYAVYHGSDGLIKIASRIHKLTAALFNELKAAEIPCDNTSSFDTLTLTLQPEVIEKIHHAARSECINLRAVSSNCIGISFDETTTIEDLNRILKIIIGQGKKDYPAPILSANDISVENALIPDNCQRSSAFLTHPVFNKYHSETAMLRYIKSLENKDFSLTHGMIPLGSCTMKLNATSEMLPISWPQFSKLHPFCPSGQALGYQELCEELSDYLAKITGYDGASLQPNSGAQGEYAGILAIKAYQQSIGEHHRNICLIPQSAHGTNPASAALAGLHIKVIKCDTKGNIDLDDLKEKLAHYKDTLSCMMITYPSTHGVFENSVKEVCDLVHQHGGQVYLDGANLNAMVGLTSPGFLGADVSHINLHKTFCIPHGGGGPGMGPIGVKSHLIPFLPKHINDDASNSLNMVSATPFGSASILPISWAYIVMMGSHGLTEATQSAILSANYIADRLKSHYPILYTGEHGRVAHECIVDIRPLKAESGISEEDIAKRLIDYGFHSPTMSFPVPHTLMIEPTESEPLEELDRFCDAMIAIKKEINKVTETVWPKDDNPLVNAPHTLADISADEWTHPYSRQLAAFPTPHQRANKIWPTVNRVDQVFGDKNLVCRIVE